MSKIILHLCAKEGSDSKPYRDAGYDVRQEKYTVDSQWHFKRGYEMALEESARVGMEAVLKTSCVKDPHCQAVAEVFRNAILALIPNGQKEK